VRRLAGELRIQRYERSRKVRRCRKNWLELYIKAEIMSGRIERPQPNMAYLIEFLLLTGAATTVGGSAGAGCRAGVRYGGQAL